jgi:N-acetylglucosamine kinase-like BadF-type ATPase
MRRAARPALLALDGGGSKLDAALVSAEGEVLGAARWRAESAGTHGAWGDGHSIDVDRAIAAVCGDTGVDPGVLPVADLGVFCLAGADLPADHRRIERTLARRGWSATTVLHNDTFAVLRAGSDRNWGVAVVCGTGMNCAGVRPDGRTFRFPAIGHISGDWGGGWDLGQAALWHAVRAEDGRGESTLLRRLVPEHFGLRRPHQVMSAIHFHRLAEVRLTELPPVVFAAAAQGDGVARSIVERQADEIVTMAATALRRLRLTALDGVDVVLGGGIFLNDSPAFLKRITAGVHEVAGRARVVVVSDPPVLGAVLLGLDRLGATVGAAARARAALTYGRLLGESTSTSTDTSHQGEA